MIILLNTWLSEILQRNGRFGMSTLYGCSVVRNISFLSLTGPHICLVSVKWQQDRREYGPRYRRPIYTMPKLPRCRPKYWHARNGCTWLL